MFLLFINEHHHLINNKNKEVYKHYHTAKYIIEKKGVEKKGKKLTGNSPLSEGDFLAYQVKTGIIYL